MAFYKHERSFLFSCFRNSPCKRTVTIVYFLHFVNMSKQIASTEELNKIQMLEFIWISIYNNRYNLSDKQWKEYNEFMHDYLLNELELRWLEFYRNKDNLNQDQWKVYERLIHQYLRLVYSKS